MRSRCAVCQHPKAEEINFRILSAEPQWRLCDDYGLSNGVVAAHGRECLGYHPGRGPMCRVCMHPDRVEIEDLMGRRCAGGEVLPGQTTTREIAERFGLTMSHVRRHGVKHLGRLTSTDERAAVRELSRLAAVRRYAATP